MASKYTAETAPYTKQAPHAAPNGSKASYTPDYAANPYIGGKDGGKAAVLGTVPQVEANGSVVGQVPAMPGTLKIGENKNVSTPVSGG